MTNALSTSSPVAMQQIGNLSVIEQANIVAANNDGGLWAQVAAPQFLPGEPVQTSWWLQFAAPFISPYTAPAVTSVSLGGTECVILGSNLASIVFSPYSAGIGSSTLVTFNQGAGGSVPVPASLTAEQIFAGGGTMTSAEIDIPLSLFTTPPVSGNTVTLSANGGTNALALTRAVEGGGNLTLTGSNFEPGVGGATATTTFAFAKSGGASTPNPATLTLAAVLGGGGSISATQVVIPDTLFVTPCVTGNLVTMTVDGVPVNVNVS